MEKYEFIASQIAKENKLILPKLYGFINLKKQKLLHGKYLNHGRGT
jgi:hypothetical protein